MTAAPLTKPAPVDEDVRALVARARSGDTEAFAALYEQYRTTIHRLVYRQVRDQSVAEDLTSETFTRALRGIGRFTWQGRHPIVWLATIANNLVRDHFRLARQRLEIVSSDSVIGQQGRGPAAESSTESAALARVTRRVLLDAIAKLPAAQRECLALRFYGDLDTYQTAARMGTTPRAVVSLQYRAVQALADLLPAKAVVG
ncbi:MAG: polymerase sigma-70 factor, subfamily [Micromonosporaceae bacterium]